MNENKCLYLKERGEFSAPFLPHPSLSSLCLPLRGLTLQGTIQNLQCNSSPSLYRRKVGGGGVGGRQNGSGLAQALWNGWWQVTKPHNSHFQIRALLLLPFSVPQVHPKACPIGSFWTLRAKERQILKVGNDAFLRDLLKLRCECPLVASGWFPGF